MEQIRFATKHDFDRLIELDASEYTTDWLVTNEFATAAWERNQEIYRVLESNEEIQGFIAFFPLEKSTFEALLVHELDENKLCDYIIPYKKGETVYIYLANIIVNQSHKYRKRFAKLMIQEIRNEINRIKALECNIGEIGAIAITDAGVRVLDRSQLIYTGKYPGSDLAFVYRGTTF
ncbi:hypothetical protein [Bacillus sp. AFS055030]|uniref:hypothetical protein n=1 Tax=Bacillus sp. AFS055030 TaxID=2033507 RepID=UPI000BFD62A9|nr:hypothetical protein [Bacillus sp. AFS055030]PGL70982.1 hypothetical protein CN925_08985 [Bacillus sp. AFS055030]